MSARTGHELRRASRTLAVHGVRGPSDRPRSPQPSREDK